MPLIKKSLLCDSMIDSAGRDNPVAVAVGNCNLDGKEYPARENEKFKIDDRSIERFFSQAVIEPRDIGYLVAGDRRMPVT
jgi:hypothetical protein